MITSFVGDPVDVITGAQFDVALDFRIAWVFPFEWRRFYNSAQVGKYLPLGWGHTHSYDHRLRYDADGLLYTDPSGVQYGFSLTKESALSFAGTGTLRRVDSQTYRVKVGGHPECEFQFINSTSPARLQKVLHGSAYQELRYDSAGSWIELVYKSEPPIRIESDDAGRIHALVWPGKGADGSDRLLWQGKYDQDSNLVTVQDPYQTTQTFAYDAAHRMIRRTDRRGYAFVASNDSAGRCIYSAGEDGMQEVRLGYLPEQSVTIVTRADGGAWQYFYQPEGISQIIDPYGGVTRRLYGTGGRLEREIGPMDEVLQEIVDEESGLLRPPFTPPAGKCLLLGDPWFEHVRALQVSRDALAWDGYGEARCRNVIRFPSRKSAWLDELPPAVVNVIRFTDRPEEAGPAEHPVPAIWHEPAPKKPIGVPDRPGAKRWDLFGRLISHTLPTGQACRWQYDPNGAVARYVDYAGSEWRFEYASWNLRVREIDPFGNATAYAFSLLEKPTRITDGGGTSTEHAFDLKDRMTERRRHNELRDGFSYDSSQGLVSAAKRDGDVRVTLKMGLVRRPVEIAPAGQPVRKCEYDKKGKLIAVSEENGDQLTFAYASLGDCTADLRNGRGVERRFKSFQLAGCVVLGKFSIEYTHDSKTGRTTIVDPMGGRHSVEQLDLGIFLRRHANGAAELAQFDWNGQCLAKARFGGNGTDEQWSRRYRYSPEGELLDATDSAYGTSTYQYDAAHRLIAASTNGHQGTFAYDAADNLLEASGLEGASYSENRLLTANDRHFQYNDRHNIIRESGADTERQYEYDAEDRLTACSIGGSRITFRYDALGRRVEKINSQGVTEFIWDGERLAAEISPAGSLRVYIYADGSAPTPFAFIDYESVDADPASGHRYYVFSDQIACPIRVEDDSGQILWRAQIDPYGRAQIRPNAAIEVNLRWPGHYYDSETGLHYNRHRYYNPELARYIQVDPRDIEGGLNVYTYPARPLDKVDVDGLAPCPKKPMVEPDESDPEFQKAKQQADEVSENLRQALKDAKDDAVANGEDPRAIVNTTLTSMVVVRDDGTYEVVVTGNRSDARLPTNVTEAIGDNRYIAHGDDRPPPVRQDDDEFRFGRDKSTGEREPTTHKHAEQRGLRATDCDPETQGVAYIAPTRPCCEGCSRAIQDRGGTDSNVSDLGRQPGSHGDWW